METRIDLDHIVCGACRIEWLGDDVLRHVGDSMKKERCCHCGYMTLYGVRVKKVTDLWYCQKEKVHE